MCNLFFITGTDTNIGKTVITTAILNKLSENGYNTIGLKPIASGCEITADGLRNHDATQLQQAASIKLDYEKINPIALASPISPHIAANQNNQKINLLKIVEHCKHINQQYQPDFLLIEGAGGWFAPINEQHTFADLATMLNANIIFVTGLQLGCLNHSLLTIQALQYSKLTVSGWIANTIDPTMLAIKENIDTLRQKIEPPCLGVVPYLTPTKINLAKKYINVNAIVGSAMQNTAI